MAMPRIRVHAPETVGLLGRPPNAPNDRGRTYLIRLVQEGAGTFVDNAPVTARALEVDGRALPLLLSGGEPGSADICSPHAHYVSYTREELAKRHPSLPTWFPELAMRPLDALLAIGRIGHAAYVNNWLLTSNPRASLSAAQVASLTDLLAVSYPRAAIIVRSLNPRTDRRGMDALRSNGYKFVRSRRVYLLDPRDRSHLRHKNARVDLRLLDRTPYEIVEAPEAIAPHVSRIAHLYREIYLEKHSRLNAAYNARFISLTLETSFFVYRALRRDDRIDAFVGFLVDGGVLMGTILGYDQRVPRRLGLLRLIFAIMIREAAERGLLLHLSAGIGRFKMLRGAVPVEEYDAVYDRHLGIRSRSAWSGLSAVTRLWAHSPEPDPANSSTWSSSSSAFTAP